LRIQTRDHGGSDGGTQKPTTVDRHEFSRLGNGEKDTTKRMCRGVDGFSASCSVENPQRYGKGMSQPNSSFREGVSWRKERLRPITPGREGNNAIARRKK
jgi:hypothetical protein